MASDGSVEARRGVLGVSGMETKVETAPATTATASPAAQPAAPETASEVIW